MLSKKRKILVIVSSFMFTFILGVQSIEAAIMGYCSNCGRVTAHMSTTERTYAHDELFPCSHGTHKYDRYSVYEVRTTTRCNSCGSSFVTIGPTEHVYKYCTN